MPGIDQEIRTLFTDAAGDVPQGIDLLHGFSRRRARRRVRARVALASAAASLVAAATAVTLTIATAPSAFAQLTSAASRTAGLSYDISATVAAQPLRAGPGAAQSGRISGAFDPARKTGEETIGDDGQIRFIGPYVYQYVPPPVLSGPPLPAGKSWVRLPGPQLWEPLTAGQGLRVAAGIASLAETNPQNLLAIIKAASKVDRQGSASGDGWTGTSYAFTTTIIFDGAGNPQTAVTATGTVGVDQQGRVRRFDAAYTQPAPGSGQGLERVTVEMTFSDFGTAVSVSPPPAGEVYIQ